MRSFKAAFLVFAALVLNSCSYAMPMLYLVNHSGGFIRILHASSEGRRDQTLAWWGNPWSYFAIIGDHRGHEILPRSIGDPALWLVQIGTRGCRAWYEIALPANSLGDAYFVVRLERDLRLYAASATYPLDDDIPNDIPQPTSFPVGPSGVDCSSHLLD